MPPDSRSPSREQGVGERDPLVDQGERLPYYGPVRVVGTVGEPPTCITVGNRVKAYWQRYGYILGNATVAGFEVEPETGWIKVVVRTDLPTALGGGEDGRTSRWDWDRTELVSGCWPGETQEESVGRWIAYLNETKDTVIHGF